MTSPELMEKMLGRVRGLLSKADDEAATPQESATYRAKAEDLMRKYRIAEEDALAQDPAAMAPEMVEVEVSPSYGMFGQHKLNLFHAIAIHSGIRARYYHSQGNTMAQAVGYQSDIKITELLYTSALMVFSEKLDPQIKPELTEAQNIYRLRSAGIKRNRIAEMLWGAGPTDGVAHGKVARIYKAECERRGEKPALDGRGVNAGTFRETYADEFLSMMRVRLKQARDGADALGGAVQLHGRKERVNEAFYERFPEFRPSTEVTERKPCEACKKRKDGTPCRDHKPRAWTKADEAAYVRKHESAAAQAGRSAGRAAAEAVDLSGQPKAQRLDRYTDGERTDAREIWAAIEGH